jgi:hypothetical protein
MNNRCRDYFLLMLSSELPENGLYIPARPAGGVFGRRASSSDEGFLVTFFRKKVTKKEN